MPMFNFHIQNIPTTPVEQNASADDASSSMQTPTSLLSSPGSCDPGSKGNNSRWNNRRRRKGAAPRNTEKRPYHSPTHVSPPHDKPMTKNDMYFALDCEMVGVGPEGLESAVARVTICNWAENVILDTFVQVPVTVTDYRTFVSGIEAKDLDSDKAASLTEVRETVKNILHGKILIGHALENDLAALQITHPWHDIRDTANYQPFMKQGESDKTALRPRKLKELVRDKLGQDIQSLGKAHDPIEDANAALRLYKTDRMAWEKSVMKQVASSRVHPVSPVPRVHEGRESESSGRHSPVSPYRGYSGAASVSSGLVPDNTSYTQAHSMYFQRSRSAPTPMMTQTNMMAPNQGYGQHRTSYGQQAYYHQNTPYLY